MATIPLVDLEAQHEQIAAEVAAGFADVLASKAFILGPRVSEFEREFARFSAVDHCVGVANGTDALELAIRAAGIGAGDEVLVPANTFIATALAVSRSGALPVLVDQDPTYHLIDVEAAARAVTDRTKAVIPVHLYGQLAPMAQVMDLSRAHSLVVVEDAAQCQGASQNGTPAGGFGAAAGTSFYPGKNLGAYGDAGAVLTGDEAIAAKVRALRNYGSEVKYHHPEAGFNSRLDSLQAVVLLAKLKRLAGWNQARAEAARRYDALLERHGQVVRPRTLLGNLHVWHLYVVRVPNRDRVLQRMHDRGIGAGVHYPVPIHLQGAFAHLGHRRGEFPNAERAADEILSLPLYPEITPELQERVVAALAESLE